MKPSNILKVIFFVLFLVGFLFFKDWFTKIPINTNASESASSPVLMDRIQYLDYSNQNLLSSESWGKTVLFFAATTWCSSCAALDAEIKNRISQLPSDTTILKVDYDRDSVAKAKYGVTSQTTLILLDKNGQETKRWIGSTFDDLVEHLN